MLRTAALAQLILEHWKDPAVDAQAVIAACLFHDIAKPMTFDLAKQAQFGMAQQDIQRLAALQNRLTKMYGSIEHHATVMICREIGLSANAVTLVDHLEWSNIPQLLQQDAIASLLPIYCDMRIGPRGLLSLLERLQELQQRVGGDDYDENVRNGQLLEKRLREYIPFDAISEETLDQKLPALLNLEL